MALSAGVLLGLIAMLVQYVGLFMTGIHTGLFISLASLATAEQFSHPPTLLTTAGTMLGSGLFFAVLNLQWPKGKYSTFSIVPTVVVVVKGLTNGSVKRQNLSVCVIVYWLNIYAN